MQPETEKKFKIIIKKQNNENKAIKQKPDKIDQSGDIYSINWIALVVYWVVPLVNIY